MKNRTTKRKLAEAAVGAALGGVIAGPIGAVAGGLAAGHVESGLDRLGRLKLPSAWEDPASADPVTHAHLKRILVPLDFSPPSRRALRFAKEWARLFGAELRLFHVIEPTSAVGEFGTVPFGQLQRDLAGRARDALKQIAREMFPEPMPVSVEVRKGVAYDEIRAAAVRWKADLILIATHGRSGLKHVLVGSTAERVVRHAPCPVLTLRRAPGKPRGGKTS